jgi:hypothetical protein
MALFASYRNVFDGAALTELCRECEVLFTAKDKVRGAYSEGQTFWVSADCAQPRSLVEAFALAVFRWHTRREKPFDPALSGVEYWSLVMERTADVGAHFDKDYGAEDRSEHFYPTLGTVTYLCGSGAAPTLFFDCCEDELPKRIGKAFASKVEPGKHVVFDGRLLHAATTTLASPGGGEGQKRVTLLVNIWLNHKPSDAVQGPASAGSFELWRQMELPKAEAPPTLSVPLGENFLEMRLDKKRLLRFCPPSAELLWSSPSSSLMLEFADGACLFEKRKKEKKKEKNRSGKKGNKGDKKSGKKSSKSKKKEK